MDPSYGEPDYLDDGLIQEQDLPYDDEDDEKLDETFGDDLPVGKYPFLRWATGQKIIYRFRAYSFKNHSSS